MSTRPVLTSLDPQRRRGIALLVTIVLLVFLVLIMVALSSLVRVETQIATNTQALAQARQNAMFGLNMAIGKLQETAGPDKRVTARADLSITNANQPNLIGVYDTSNGTPDLITWLVSGNEDHTVDPKITPTSLNNIIPTVTSKALVPANTLPFNDTTPAASGVTATAPEFGAGYASLVAGGSVDLGTATGYKDAVAERVLLRKSPIKVDGAKVSGKAPGSTVTVGNYAYWVSDDGIKASIGTGNQLGSGSNSQQDLHYDDSGATPAGMDYYGGNAATDADYIHRKMLNSLQLQGVRADLLFRDTANTDLLSIAQGDPSYYGALAHPTIRSKIFSPLAEMSSLSFINDFALTNPPVNLRALTAPTREAALRTRLKQRFHDATPKSRAVLTDMINGGLRKDLSFGLTLLDPKIQPGAQTFLNIWRSSSAPANTTSPDGLLSIKCPIIPYPDTKKEPHPAFARTPPTDTAYFPVVPIITEFELQMVFKIVGGNLKAVFSSEIELWNPYNVTLTLPSNLYITIPIKDSTDNATLSELDIQMTETLPQPPAPAPAIPPVIQNKILDIAATMGWKRPVIAASLNSHQAVDKTVNLVFQIVEQPGPNPGQWEPGQIKVWELGLHEMPAIDQDGNPIVATPTGGTVDPTKIEVRTNSASRLDVKMHMGNAGLGDMSNQDRFVNATDPLYEIRGIVYDSTPDYASSGGAYYYFRLNDQTDYEPMTVPLPVAWLDKVDPRGPVVYQAAATLAAPATYTLMPVNSNPAGGSNFDTDPGEVLRNENFSAAGEPPVRVALFDLPRQEVLGVAALQNLAFSGSSVNGNGRAYRIGSVSGGFPNGLFETHFISSVPRKPFAPASSAWFPRNGDLLANTGLRVFDPAGTLDTSNQKLLNDTSGSGPTGLQSERAAEYLLIEDAFNINSTSIPAWMAILGGSLPTLADPGAAGGAPPPYLGNQQDDYVWNPSASEMLANWRCVDTVGGTVDTHAVRNVFFRLPHTANHIGVGTSYPTLKTELEGADVSKQRNAAFRLGLRELTVTQVKKLASEVVSRIKARGKPYVTVTQFVNEKVSDAEPFGVLQAAINAVTDINNPKSADAIPYKSTGYLMQGDILQLIGHRLVARSDTFTIRAYGDVVNPISNAVDARAWVEATVQRTPTKDPSSKEPDDSMKETEGTPGDGNFGRQFKVVRLRWLDSTDI